MICALRHCGKTVGKGYARFKLVDGEMRPFHVSCSYAHPDYDPSERLGSPFSTIHRQVI